MARSTEAGKLRLSHLIGIAIAGVLGLALGWWYMHGGDQKAKEALSKAEQGVNGAKAAADQSVQKQNADFDASRERHTPK